MSYTRPLAPLALAAALAAIAPATAGAKTIPSAHAAGGDVVVLTYPSLVKTRVARAKRALRRGINQIEDGQSATAKLTVVRRQMAAAWRGAKYIIRTTPPPPPAEDRAAPTARASGGGPTGPTKAAPADTAFLVITLQHTVAAGMIQSIDGSDDPALGTTLNFALNQRDQAISDVVALAPPAPPADDRAAPTALASGGAPVASTFDTVMPNAVDQLDDELQAIDGIKSDSTDLTAAGRSLLSAATTRIAKTRGVVNKTWPPIPAED